MSTTLLGAAVVGIVPRLAARVRRHPVRRFWRGFGTTVSIVTTEYEVANPDEVDVLNALGDDIELRTDQAIAAHATSGYFISYGMALALADLRAHFARRRRCAVRIVGDKRHGEQAAGSSLVVVGSPANNHYLQRFLPDFSRRYPMLAQFRWEARPAGVSLVLPDGQELVPDVDETESGYDYALVSRFALDPTGDRRIVVLSGCNMWVTEAAALFVLDPGMLKLLPRTALAPAANVAFVLRTRVSFGRADAPELYGTKETPAFIYDL